VCPESLLINTNLHFMNQVGSRSVYFISVSRSDLAWQCLWIVTVLSNLSFLCCQPRCYIVSHNCVLGAGIAQSVSDYGLDDRAIGVRSPAEAKDLCQMDTGGPFPGCKARPWRDADHSLHLVPRSRISRSYTASSPSTFMACSGTALLIIV
jgi:hypothetical protein